MNWMVSGPGGVNYRAHYGTNNTFEMDLFLEREREFVFFNLGREFLSFSLGLREENDIFSR